MSQVLPKKIMLIAGEASGDALGAGLISALSAKTQDEFIFFGLGGSKMAEAGIDSPFDISELSIIGYVEALKAASRIKKRISEVVAWALREKPYAIVLIDSWGFTIRVAKAIRKADPSIRLIKYVAPQVWAMRPKRAKVLADSVDLLLALHPMDRPYFITHGLNTVVVGNPAVHVDLSDINTVAFRKRLLLSETSPVLLLLPGSRPSEIKRLMPVFADTLKLLQQRFSGLSIILPVASAVREQVTAAVQQFQMQVQVIDSDEDKYAAMMTATTALACSGTVSTELALCGCPMVIAYKVEPITYWIFENLSTIDYVTMINIIGGHEIVPEFIQQRCNPENLSEALAQRLSDDEARKRQIELQYSVLDSMGRNGPNTHDLAAEAVIDFCRQ